MNGRSIILLAAFVLACQPRGARAGPDWVEDSDAGSLPGTAQAPKGDGEISYIMGDIEGAAVAGGGDTEDMYAILITDPVNFRADTIVDGSATFDTQLWLFTEQGVGLLANDNTTFGSGSILFPPADDGTGQTIPGPGLYMLAISGFDNDPLSSSSVPMFNQAIRTEVSGPDGSGGSQRIGSWGTSTERGTYVIALTGAAFPPPAIPTTSEWGLATLALLILVVGTILVRQVAMRNSLARP